MPDLFDWSPSQYPRSPGAKERTTSAEAARKTKPRAQGLRDRVLIELRKVWPEGLTADEVAARVGKKEFSIRPRLSELRALRAVQPRTTNGVVDKRDNESGMAAIVWVAKRSYGENR